MAKWKSTMQIMDRYRYIERVGHRILLVFMFIGTVVSAQVKSLDEVVTAIKSNHPALKSKIANANALQAYARGAKSWDAPQIGAGFFMTPYQSQLWQSQNMMDANGNMYYTPGMGQFMLQFQQMIPNPIRQSALMRYQTAMSLVEMEDKVMLENELVAQAKEAYFGIAVDQRKLILLLENERLAQLALKTAQNQYSSNEGKLAAVYQMESKLLDIQNSILEIETSINEKKILLNTWMNVEPNKPLATDTSLKIMDVVTVDVDTQMVFQRRSDLKNLKNQLTINKLNSDYQKVRISPDFGVRYDHMFTFGTQPQLFTLMGMVNLPFVPWASRESVANRIAMAHERTSIEWQQKSIKNELVGKLESLRKQMIAKKRQSDRLSKGIVPVMYKNYQTTLFAYEQNQEIFPTVLEAWESYQEVKMQQLTIYQELISLQVQYEKEIQSE